MRDNAASGVRRGCERVPARPEPLEHSGRAAVAGEIGDVGERRTAGLARRQRAEEPLELDGAELPAGGVVGEHAGEEQREVAEPAVEAGPVRLGHGLHHLREAGRVELAEALLAPAVVPLHPHRAADHPRVRREVLHDEVAAGRVGRELGELGGVEHGNAHAGPDALVDEAGVAEVVEGAVDRDREHEEGRHIGDGGRFGRAEDAFEGAGGAEDGVEEGGFGAQRGGGARRLGQQRQVGVGQVLEVRRTRIHPALSGARIGRCVSRPSSASPPCGPA